MLRKNKNKKSQVTIFIIMALIIVVVFIMIFMLFRKPEIVISSKDPGAYIGKCMKDAVKEAEVLLLAQGGFVEPRNYKLYENEKVGYLCYSKKDFEPCIMQKPMFIQHLNKEIVSYTESRIEQCFSSLQDELGKKYIVSLGEQEVKSEMAPKSIKLSVERDLTIKREETSKFEEFKITVGSPLYDLAIIAQEIASQEAKDCSFDIVDFMLLNSQFKIDKFITSDDEKIYTITEKSTQKKLNIAIRSCVMPPKK